MRCVGAFGRYTEVEGVQGYLGRAERKKAFGRYRGVEGRTGYFGNTRVEETIWKIWAEI